MSSTMSGTAAVEASRPSRGYWKDSWSRLRSNAFGVACGIVLLAMGLVALLAPWVSDSLLGRTPDAQDLGNVFASPSTENWLGTDELGRDTLTRLVWGGRVTLGVGFLTVAILIAVGGTIGLVAGYYGGLIGGVLMRLVDMILAIPPFFLLILVVSLLPVRVGPVLVEHNGISLSLVIALTSWGGVARLVRGEVLSVKTREFIVAARAVGVSDFRQMVRHVLPNVVPVLVVAASLGVGHIILLQAALDFVGLGVQPPTASWGNMLLKAQSYTFQAPVQVVFPGAAIMIAVLAANIFGNILRDALDPRMRP